MKNMEVIKVKVNKKQLGKLKSAYSKRKKRK